MTTLLYAIIDADWTEVRYASAGHPPPLVLRGDGTADFLWEGRSTPPGVYNAGDYGEGATTLEGGSTLLLYTDGLVEVPGEDLLSGLERLREAARAGPADPNALCEHVIEAMLGERGASDDVALLALRTTPLVPESLRLELTTDPSSLRYARRMLGRWLVQAGATEREVWDVQLAAHEAFANAIEHAYRFGDAVVVFEARCADGEAVLTVSDSGDWREQPTDGGRGRGLPLMKGLMDDVTVEGGGGGTRVELRRRLGLGEGAAGSAARARAAVD
jgi:anti-sigma regulatory factor (Ser/Thr protein kinase)